MLTKISLFIVCLLVVGCVSLDDDYRPNTSTLKNALLKENLHSIKLSNVRVVNSKREVDFVTLSLQPFSVWTDDAKIYEPLPSGGERVIQVPRYKSYTGAVDGKQNSIAGLYLEQNEAKGLVEMDGKHFNVRNDDQEGIFLEEMDSETDFIPPMLECAVPPPESDEETYEEVQHTNNSKRNNGPNPNIIRMAIDCHQTVFDRYNGNTTAVASYFAGVFTVINSFFRPELLAIIQMSALVCGPTPHYTFDAANSAALTQFRNHWQNTRTSVVRDTAHLMVSRNFGGIAYLNSVCNTAAYGLNGLTFNTHRDIWDYVIIAHELGHNIGSRHTHCYNPPIDNCHSGESGCFSGTASVPATGGSIMSYCHTRSGGLRNIQLSMGAPNLYGVNSERVLSSIRTYLNSRQSANCLPICQPISCTGYCGNIADGCGGTINCGTCAFGNCTTANVCFCSPATCIAQGKECGPSPDFCGGTLNCGSCAGNEMCSNNGTCVQVSLAQNAEQLDDKDGNSTALLAGILGGVGALLLAVIATIIFIVARRRKMINSSSPQANEVPAIAATNVSATQPPPSKPATRPQAPQAKPLPHTPPQMSPQQASYPSHRPLPPSSVKPLPPPSTRQPTFAIGTMCQVKYSADGLFYRARIQQIQGGRYLVSYVDFGNDQEWVPASSLKQI